MGSPVPADGSLGRPVTQAYTDRYEYTTQFDSADRIAAKWGLSRGDCDAFAVRSQARAAEALTNDVFDSQIIGIEIPDANSAAAGGATTRTEVRDDVPGPRPWTGWRA